MAINNTTHARRGHPLCRRRQSREERDKAIAEAREKLRKASHERMLRRRAEEEARRNRLSAGGAGAGGAGTNGGGGGGRAAEPSHTSSSPLRARVVGMCLPSRAEVASPRSRGRDKGARGFTTMKSDVGASSSATPKSPVTSRSPFRRRAHVIRESMSPMRRQPTSMNIPTILPQRVRGESKTPGSGRSVPDPSPASYPAPSPTGGEADSGPMGREKGRETGGLLGHGMVPLSVSWDRGTPKKKATSSSLPHAGSRGEPLVGLTVREEGEPGSGGGVPPSPSGTMDDSAGRGGASGGEDSWS